MANNVDDLKCGFTFIENKAAVALIRYGAGDEILSIGAHMRALQN